MCKVGKCKAGCAVNLTFALEVDDGWPPVAVEVLPCEAVENGYRIDAAPLFVKGLSVNDVIRPEVDDSGRVLSWMHVEYSTRSTIWLLRIAETDRIAVVLKQLRGLGCNTVQLPNCGCYSIDVPGACAIHEVDRILSELDKDQVAVAYPSFRHQDD